MFAAAFDSPALPSLVQRRMMRSLALRCAAPALLVITLVLVPFVDGAFTIDDPTLLDEALQARGDPLHPVPLEGVWGHGPVMAWLLVPAVASAHPERTAHVTQLALMALAVIAAVSLGLRLGLAPAWATASGLLIAANPTALGMASTAMPDVAAMALGVAGVERLVAWRDGGGVLRAISAALLLALATLARAPLAALLFIGALLLAADPSGKMRLRTARWIAWLPLAAAPVLVALVLIVLRRPESSVASTTAVIATLNHAINVPRNAVSFFVHVVFAIPLAIPWALLRARSFVRRWPVLLVALAPATLLARFVEGPHPGIMIAVAAFGFTVVADVVADAWARRDLLQLTLAAWLFTPLAAIVYTHFPAKYLLAAAPAVALLVAREATRHAPRRAWAVVGATIAAGGALGLLVVRADDAFASFGRRAAEELVAAPVAAGERVWFMPDWGFRWYARRAGGIPTTTQPPYPEHGDLLVSSEKTYQPGDVQRMVVARYRSRIRHIVRLQEGRPGGRTMDMTHGAGFFSNAWGDLPWTWSSEPLDAFDLWRIE